MSMLLRKAQRHADAGPFLAPVSAEEVPDYYQVIVVRLLVDTFITFVPVLLGVGGGGAQLLPGTVLRAAVCS